MCPHCKWETNLTVEAPETILAPPKRRFIGIVILLLVALIGVAIGVVVLLKKINERKPRVVVARPIPAVPSKQLSPKPAPVPIETVNDFDVERLAIEAAPSGSLLYATGVLRNKLSRQRFSVSVEIECLDVNRKVVGTASDYVSTIDGAASWKFRALVLKGRPVSLRVLKITEQQ